MPAPTTQMSVSIVGRERCGERRMVRTTIRRLSRSAGSLVPAVLPQIPAILPQVAKVRTRLAAILPQLLPVAVAAILAHFLAIAANLAPVLAHFTTVRSHFVAAVPRTRLRGQRHGRDTQGKHH